MAIRLLSGIGDWIPDPRLEALGQRMLLPSRDKATSPAGEPETEGYEYRTWRIEHGIAEGDTEITSGEMQHLLADLPFAAVETCSALRSLASVKHGASNNAKAFKSAGCNCSPLAPQPLT